MVHSSEKKVYVWWNVPAKTSKNIGKQTSGVFHQKHKLLIPEEFKTC